MPGWVAEAVIAPRADDAELAHGREELIDEQLAQSFPASDPPSWVQGTAPEPC